MDAEGRIFSIYSFIRSRPEAGSTDRSDFSALREMRYFLNKAYFPHISNCT